MRVVTARIWPAAVVVCVLTAACGGRLPDSVESPEALAQAVLDAVERGDEAALRRLALDEQEFREQVWPELPASRPERNLPFSYVWSDLRTKSGLSLDGILREHRGRTYTLERIRFTGGTTQYRTFVVHRESALDVRDSDGRRQTLRLFGSAIEKSGRFKVFSYVID